MAGCAECSGAQQERLGGGVEGVGGDAAGGELGGVDTGGGDQARAIAVGGHVLPPCDDMALGVEACPEGVLASGAVVVVGNVVLAGPEELDGDVDLLGEPGGFDEVVVVQAAAKASADAAEVDCDVGGLDVERAGGLGAAFGAGRLAGGPELELAVFKGGGCAHRLKRSVSEEGICVGGFDDPGGGGEGGVHIAIAAQGIGGRRFEESGGAGGEGFAALGDAGAEVPLDLECPAGRLGLPPCVGDDGDAGLDSGGDDGYAGLGGGVD